MKNSEFAVIHSELERNAKRELDSVSELRDLASRHLEFVETLKKENERLKAENERLKAKLKSSRK